MFGMFSNEYFCKLTVQSGGYYFKKKRKEIADSWQTI